MSGFAYLRDVPLSSHLRIKHVLPLVLRTYSVRLLCNLSIWEIQFICLLGIWTGRKASWSHSPTRRFAMRLLQQFRIHIPIRSNGQTTLESSVVTIGPQKCQMAGCFWTILGHKARPVPIRQTWLYCFVHPSLNQSKTTRVRKDPPSAAATRPHKSASPHHQQHLRRIW